MFVIECRVNSKIAYVQSSGFTIYLEHATKFESLWQAQSIRDGILSHCDSANIVRV